MSRPGQSITILMADDDPDDRMLTRDAFAASRLANDLRFVTNGEELMDYLRRRGPYSATAAAPRPDVILLDLNMPRKSGREALREIKGDSNLRRIPVIILTTSKAEEDVYRGYDLGANCYIQKPVTFASLVEVVHALGTFWFQIVTLPPDTV